MTKISSEREAEENKDEFLRLTGSGAELDFAVFNFGHNLVTSEQSRT